MAEQLLKTLTIDNFQGRLSRYREGDINSGYANYNITFGNDPFSNPGNLTWFEEPTRIDPDAVIITDLIMAMRPRLESGITYVYAIGHTGRLYKIQVNDPTTYNPNYDNPVLLTTLASNTPTFKYGSSIDFYGSTEKIFIGHDKGVTKVNFDGSGETFVGSVGTWTQNVPRPSSNFTGSLFYGNGTNIAQVDSTETVTTYTKLSPGFPSGTQVRDIDVSPDGNYLQITVSQVSQADMTTTTQDTSSISSGSSYLFLWNGTDTGYSSFTPFNSYSINSNISFGQFGYTMGYDQNGTALYNKDGQKIVTLQNFHSPNFSAMFSTGNLLGFVSPESFDPGTNNGLTASLVAYGAYDEEIPQGIFRHFTIFGTNGNEAIQMPACTVVSNLFYGSSSSGYTGSKVGSAKLYFSVLYSDTNGIPTYTLYKFTTVPTGGSANAIGGIYQTQTQVFTKKVKVSEVRIYTEPLQDNSSFLVALVGSDSSNPIENSSITFTAGSNGISIGQDYCWYSPDIAPTYSIGLLVQNIGSANMVITKVEIDYAAGGK